MLDLFRHSAHMATSSKCNRLQLSVYFQHLHCTNSLLGMGRPYPNPRPPVQLISLIRLGRQSNPLLARTHVPLCTHSEELLILYRSLCSQPYCIKEHSAGSLWREIAEGERDCNASPPQSESRYASAQSYICSKEKSLQ